MPIVKKLETTIKKNPNFISQLSENPKSIKKLATDPEVAKLSVILKKNNVKVTKDSIKKLRTAASNDPAKLSTLDVIDGIAQMGIVATFGAMFLCILAATGYGIYMAVSLMVNS
ncbi:Avr1b-1 avirulence-like protein [Phytophthora cinnamomi]|uniref:Avr1b-1 avirulence-like protein n=1 Tax=Phytophthora cinnamomi TaxID=4785 RepID=UPI003559A94E|nr:Avr1b-1 avirulence-like protein [Phytophthora cinnamomi]